jgi:acyl-homoserine lactone acylase PvdQ
MPVMGRSLEHGWLLTSGVAETTDTYEERLSPTDRYQYWFGGAWRRMDHRVETIKVKGQPDVHFDVAGTVHGPVVQWDTAGNIAYTERYAERGHELDNWVGGVEMARAKTLDDFQRNGVARMAWDLGICYGNEAGHIGFWEAGLLPRRSPGVDTRLPIPGTGEYEWNGFLSFAEQPHVIDPKQGYFYAWNSKPTVWSREGGDARIGRAFRTWSGTELVENSTHITLADMRQINWKINTAIGGIDRTATSPAFFAPFLQHAAQGADPEVHEAAQLMIAFNGYYQDLDKDGFYDSPGLPLFREWLKVAPTLIFGPSIDNWWSKVDEKGYLRYQTSLLLRALQGSRAGLPLKYDFWHGRDHDAVIRDAIRISIDHLKTRFTGNMRDWRLPIYWKYLDPRKKTPDKPEMPDDDASGPRMSAVLGLAPVAVHHTGGDEWTGLMELSPNEPPALYSVIEAGGQDLFIDTSGHGNKHLTDQTNLHAESGFKTIEMSLPLIKASAESVQTLAYQPSGPP